MKRLIPIAAIFFSTAAIAQLAPPPTPKKPRVYTEHGNQRVDDYYWMNTPDSMTLAHLHAENAYTEAFMKPTEPLQQKLYDEIVGRMEKKMESLPTKSNGYWYYARFDADAQYPRHYRRKGSMNAKEELLLDLPALAKGFKIFLNTARRVSPDNRYLAYAIDTTGSRRATLFIKDLQTGKLLNDRIYPIMGGVTWAADNKTVFYTVGDKALRSFKVMKHVIGTDPAQDQEVYTEQDVTFSTFLSASRDNKFIFINSSSTNQSEVRYIDASNPLAAPVLVQPRQENVLYTVYYYGGEQFFIQTNKDAKNFKLVSAPVASPGMQNWKDVIPHKPDELLSSVIVLNNYIVSQSTYNALPKVMVTDRKTNQSHNIDFGEEVYFSSIYTGTDEATSDSIRFFYTSLTTPTSEYMYHLGTRQKKLLKQQKVEGGFNNQLYESKRVWAKAGDGSLIPVSLVYRKDKMKKDGSNPLWLYAYGSYAASMVPYFDGARISLLDRGFVYAIAHIRGGQEMGRGWYEAGRQLNKKNTFTDFIDVAQQLVDEKYTSKDRLFANGVSAGGMLMGAITNMRPDLFKGIFAEVPWMDVISDMFDPNLPLVTLEYDEWGDPNKKEFYDYMLSWSPLDNVKQNHFPAIFATGGLHDTQVPYFSPAKWVARIREHNQGTNPVLLHTNMSAGHGGESGRFEREKLRAMMYSFALYLLGWNEATRKYEKGF